MASYINRSKTLGAAESVIVPLNRWTDDDYSVQVEAGTVTVNGTLAQVNRGDTPVWAVLNEAGGTPLTDVAVGLHNVDFVPLEAIQLVAGAGGATVRLMQQGSD